MKHQWKILAVLLAASTAILAFDKLTEKPAESLPAGEVILESIMTRNSVRDYTEERVSDELIEKILKAGMAAPTAANRQPWRFYVVRDKSIIKQATKVTKYAAPMNERAGVMLVVCGVPSESFPVEPRYWVQDVSAATENMLLAAHALDLGAVWCGVYPGEERVAALRELLNVPEEVVPFNMIMLGHPKGETPVKDKWKPERVEYVGN